jgi:Ca2+-binding EF-hand superfamily protein
MKKLAFATLVAMGVATAAVAQPPSQPSPPPRAQPQAVPAPPGNDRTNQMTFETADKNKDGLVNKEEGNQINGFDFSRADTNNDATLTRAEFQAAMAKSTPRGDALQSGDRTEQTTFDKADRDSDGKVSREEANEIEGFNFSQADVDDNSFLNRQEFQTAMAGSTPRG